MEILTDANGFPNFLLNPTTCTCMYNETHVPTAECIQAGYIVCKGSLEYRPLGQHPAPNHIYTCSVSLNKPTGCLQVVEPFTDFTLLLVRRPTTGNYPSLTPYTYTPVHHTLQLGHLVGISWKGNGEVFIEENPVVQGLDVVSSQVTLHLCVCMYNVCVERVGYFS